MSVRWAEQLSVSVAPQAVSAVLWGRGWSAQPRRAVQLDCVADPAGAAWTPALSAFGTWVREQRLRRVPVRVLLSNHFVRYVVVPWNTRLTRRDERLGMARHLLRQTYGEGASDWHVQLATSDYGSATLACALEEPLLAALRAVLAEVRLPCRSVQPLLAWAFNRFRTQIGDNGCLVVVEPGRLCIAAVRQGQWQGVLASRRPDDMSTARAIERQLRLMALDLRTPVFVFDPRGDAATQERDRRWQWLGLRPRRQGKAAPPPGQSP